MCFKQKDKWQKFEPTKQYLSIVSGLTSINKLYQYIQKYKYVWDIKDYWQTPLETLQKGTFDCEDMAIFALDVLVRIIGIKEARFLFHNGYNKALWDKEKHGHAITVFPYYSKLAVFSNKNFYTGIDSFEGAGKILFIDGLKYQEIRDWQGKILEKKHKWFGTF